MKKAVVRKHFLERRMRLTAAEILWMTTAICDKLIAQLSRHRFSNLHIFLTKKDKNEIDTWLLVSALRRAFPDLRLLAPVMVPGTLEMQHYRFEPSDHFILNKWNIPEPDPETAEQVKPEEIDVVILPMLAFDTLGFRVGYGGGYYDRFLAQCRPDCLKIGVTFFEPIEKIEDTDHFDIRMDACITPQKVYDWKNEEGS